MSTYIWATFVQKFAAKNSQKLPNLVTLLEHLIIIPEEFFSLLLLLLHLIVSQRISN